MRIAPSALTLASAACLAACTLCAAAQMSPEAQNRVVSATEKILKDSGVPSASVGIVQDGKIVYTHAFGLARVQPALDADADMAYPIGSISKQFTASAILLLQQQGKLSVDDPVSKYFPELTEANKVTIRNLLTHTSGYQDYAPQDYTIPAWKMPGDPLKVVHDFAGKPLDFEPGTQWQYSNTNFVLAALIVQKVSGKPFAIYLRENILDPAHLTHVLNLNTEQNKLQVTGYMRNALAPVRPAALEGPGWYFGDADLAMPVASLLTWDLTFINQNLLAPASYRQMESTFVLKNGTDSHYGFGVSVRTIQGQHAIEHSGEVGGFVAENIVFPGAHAAIAVLTNQEASNAASEITRAIVPIVLDKASAADPQQTDVFAPKLGFILSGMQAGKIDRSLFTPDANSYFDQDALTDYQSSLAPLGSITTVEKERGGLRGGMHFASYRVVFSGGTILAVSTYLQSDGKIEQLLVEGKE
jgi:D-alanyl-D-alanine carboxypeptidase